MIDVDFGRGRTETCELQFLEGLGGTLVRREYREGVLEDTDRGVFSAAPNAQVRTGEPGGMGETDSTAFLPPELAGRVYRIGSDLFRFTSADAGTKEEAGEVDPIRYLYERGNEALGLATLTVWIGADRRLDYTLTASSATGGRYEVREYRDGQLKKERSGSYLRVGP